MINGEQLMIGDYVDIAMRDFNPMIGIVKEIFNGPKGTCIAIEHGEFIDYFCEDEIQPITLSEEFFLKNGFKELCRTEYSIRLYDSDLYLRVKITPEKHFTYNHIGINYVHEFQHLLRLIGLSEIANNLKL